MNKNCSDPNLNYVYVDLDSVFFATLEMMKNFWDQKFPGQEQEFKKALANSIKQGYIMIKFDKLCEIENQAFKDGIAVGEAQERRIWIDEEI